MSLSFPSKTQAYVYMVQGFEISQRPLNPLRTSSCLLEPAHSNPPPFTSGLLVDIVLPLLLLSVPRYCTFFPTFRAALSA